MKNYDIEMWKYAKTLKHRSDNPILGHEHIPSKSAILQSVEIRLNDRGLRGGPIEPMTAGKRRIAFLGSSITLGWGVPEEKTLTTLLAQKFKQDHLNVEVLNTGIGNYNSVREVELFLTKLKDLKPTDIVVQSFVRDAEKLEPGGGNFFLQNSQLAVTLWIVYNRMMAKLHPESLLDHYKKVYDPNVEGFIQMKEALKRLSDYAKANHIKLYMAMTPDVHTLKNYPFKFIHDMTANIAKEYGYTYVDLLPGFVGLSPEKIWAMPGDPHPNALGHQIMADTLYPVLAK